MYRMLKKIIWGCYLALRWLFSNRRRAATLVWKLLKVVWYTAFVVSWCFVELIWLFVLIGTWITLKIYCCVTRLLFSPARTVESTRRAMIITTSANVLLPATSNISGVPDMTTSSSIAASTAVVTSVTASTVTNTVGNNCLLTTTKVESNSRLPEVCRSTADTTPTKATDKPCTTDHDYAAMSESLPSSPSLHLPLVCQYQSQCQCQSMHRPLSTSAVAAQSLTRSTRPVATLKTPGVTSSVSSTRSVTTCAASNVTATCDPTKQPSLYSPVVTKRSAETLPSASAVSVDLQSPSRPTRPVASVKTPAVTSSVSSTQSVATCPALSIISAFDPTKHASSYLPVVTKTFAETLSSTSAVAAQSSSRPTRPVATLKTPGITSSVNSTQSVNTCAASNITECNPTKHTSLPAVRPVKVQYDSNCIRIQDSANAHSYQRLDTVEPKPKPVNCASDAAHITQPTVEHATQSAEPSRTWLFPNITPPRAAAPANKFQSTARTSEQLAAVENTSVKLGKVYSALVATHEETMESTSSAVRYTPDSCARSDGNVPVIASTSSTSLSHSSINYKQSVCNAVPPSIASTVTRTKQTDEHSQFPLSHEYEFRLVCVMCFKPKTELMMPERTHSCRQDVLAVKQKKIGTSQWHWIRQRKPYIYFKGDYAMCFKRQNGYSCYSGCTYAHCDAERQLWNMEKYSTFSTDKFITAHQASAVSLCNVKNLLDKYPGNFFLVCKFCFEKSNMLVTVRRSPETCSRCSNPWTDVLVHVNGINNQTVAITQRRFVHSTAFYQLCYRQRFCQRRETCVHAHSQIERDVWYLQRDYNYTRLQIVDEVWATMVYNNQ